MAYGASVAGKWAYRSYLNTADQRIFGQGIFTFTTPSITTLKGTLDMGGGLVLDLDGSVRAPDKGSPLSVAIGRWNVTYKAVQAFSMCCADADAGEIGATCRLSSVR